MYNNKTGWNDMGKNKTKVQNEDPMKNKTQILEEEKRMSRGYHKNNPTKSK